MIEGSDCYLEHFEAGLAWWKVMNNDEPKQVALLTMVRRQNRFLRVRKGAQFLVVALLMELALGACSTTPLVPYTTNTPPLVLVPASDAGVRDKRGRFREIFCARGYLLIEILLKIL